MKTMIALFVALVLGGAWWWLRPDAGTTARAPEPANASATTQPAEPAAQLGSVPPQTLEGRQPLAATAPGSSALHADLAQLTCHVLWDTDGLPAADVTVVLWHTGLGKVMPVNPLAVCDADGRARFEDLPLGQAFAASDRGDELQFELAAGENMVELRIPAGLLVEGVVLDEHDQPVPGAALWISDRNFSNSSEGLWTARARSDGRFTLRDVQPKCALAARSAGHAPADGVWLDKGGPGERVEVTLHVGAAGPRLRGIVRDDGGQAIANAYVFVGSMVDPRPFGRDTQMYTTPPPQGTSTDAEGRFAFDAVPAGRALPIWIGADGFAIGHEELTLETPETWIELTLTTPASVAGVVYSESGAPLAEAEITVRVTSDPLLASRLAPWWAQTFILSDRDGAFELPALRATTVELVAELHGSGEARETVELVAGQTFAWNPVLIEARSIAGVVSDEQVALQGLKVSASAEGEERHYLGEVLTDADGYFLFPGAVRASYTLRVVDPAADVDTSLVVRGVSSGDEDLELVFPAARRASARISAHLLDEDGAPYVPEWIHIEPIELDGELHGGGSQSHCAEGRLETGLLPPGRYALLVSNRTSGYWIIDTVDLAAGETRDLGERVCPAPGRIELDLRDAAGAPPSGVTLVAKSEASGMGKEIELHDGHGVAEPVQPGFYSLDTSGYDLPLIQVRVEVRAGETTHTALQLPASVARWIALPTLEGEGMVGCTMEWRRDGARVSRTSTVFSKRQQPPLAMQLTPGHYEVEITRSDGKSAISTFEVSASTTGVEQAVTLRWP